MLWVLGAVAKLVLHLHGTLNRFDDRWKFGDQAIAGGIDDPAAVALDQFSKDRTCRAKSGKRRDLILILPSLILRTSTVESANVPLRIRKWLARRNSFFWANAWG